MVARRRTLLLADDSLTIQKVVSLTFSDEGVEVVTASDGAQALRRLEEGPPPDIILADTYMPGPDGYQICERVKRDPSLRHIPVVLLVGTFEPFNEAEARRVGADMVLTKPFQSIKGLVSKVGSLFGGGRQEEEQEATRPLPSAETGARREQSRDFGGARPWDEPRVTETHEGASGVEPAVAASAAEVPFADLELDDQMIESRAVESPDAWASHGERPADWHEEMSVGSWDAHAQPADFEPAPPAHVEARSEDNFAHAGSQYPDEPQSFAAQLADERQSFEAPAAESTSSWEQGFDQPPQTQAQSFDAPAYANETAYGSESAYAVESPRAAAQGFDDSARPAAQSFNETAQSFNETARAAAQGFGEASPASSRGFEENSYAEARPSAPAVGVASATDDALLDLDDVDFPGVASPAPAPSAGLAPADDDFILDLDDGAPRPQSAAHAWADFVPPGETRDAQAEPHADAAGSLAEAAHGRETDAPELSGRVGEQTFYFDDAQDETPTVIAPAPRIVWDEQQEQYVAESVSADAAPAQEAPQAFDPEATRTFDVSAVGAPTASSPSTEASAHAAESPVETAVTYEDSGASLETSAPTPPASVATQGEPAASQAAPSARAEETHAAGARQIRLEDLSPEVIDAIARRVVEQMSEGVVREIAWEVVPELSELLIKQRLDEKQ